MMRYFLLFLCCFSFLFLHAEDFVNYTEPKEVSSSEGVPSTLSNGTVCVISGEYVESSEDLVLPGPEAFAIRRSYGSHARGNFGTAWVMGHQEVLLCANVIREGERCKLFRLIEASGAQVDYVSPANEYKKKKRINPKLIVPRGLTNGANFLSGRTNLKNQVIHYDTEEHTLSAVSGAGNRKVFRYAGKTGCGNYASLLTREEKVNASVYLFERDADHKKKISCKSAKTGELYSGLKYSLDHYTEKEPLVITANDGREIKYYFKQHKYTEPSYAEPTGKHSGKTIIEQHYLAKVESSYTPNEWYSYEKKCNSKNLHVVLKKKPNGRFLETKYYEKGHNSLGKKIKGVDIDEPYDYRVDRVKEQLAPVGTTHEAIPIHRYVYNSVITKNKYGSEKLEEGTTDVYDAKSHKTTYSHDKNHRLTEIERFSGSSKSDYVRSSRERFIWGKDDEEGNLIGKTFKDEQGVIRHARCFTYDKAGNVLTSTLYGNLSGRSSLPIIVNEEKMPINNGVEQEQKSYIYSQDGLNLCLSETDSNGKKTIYRYIPNTDRLRAKYIEVEGKIIHREFYTYNDHFTLTQKMIDDGCALHPTDVTDVTSRLFTDHTPRKAPPLGLAEITEESYFDFKRNEKVLLKETHFQYSKEGRVLQARVFDANRKLAATLNLEYDLHGNVISETNAAGQIIKRKYDANNNLIFEEGPGDDFAIHNTYDYVDRLICQKEIHADGKVFTTTHSYDTVSNCIATTNPYGEETKKAYNDFGLVEETLSPAVFDENGQVVYPKTSTLYDAASLPVRTIDPKGRKTKTKYNARGQPIEILHQSGLKELWVYQLDGKLREKTEKTGVKTVYKRDSLGRIFQESTYGADGTLLKRKKHRYNNHSLIETIDEAGNLISYAYDRARRLIAKRTGDRVEKTSYDSLGRIQAVRTWYGSQENEYRATFMSYDALNRVIEERIEGADGTVLQKNAYAYDVRGNRTFTQMGEVTTTTVYDRQNQPIEITNTLGETTHITYNHTYKNTLGQNVLQTTATDPLGYQTIDTYDAANRLVEVTRKNPLGTIVAHEETFYDLLGNRVKVMRDVIEKEQVKDKHITFYTYSLDNQITSITEAAGSAEQKITRTAYNELGQKASTIKPDGTVISYTYDGLGRVETITSSDQTIAYRYTYNVFDQIAKVKDLIHGEVTTREYDTYGNMVKEVLGNGLALSYTYDNIGRIHNVILPDGSGVEYVYDALNLKEIHRVVDDKRVYTHRDAAHNLSCKIMESILPGDVGKMVYAYDAIGRCVESSSSHYHQSIPQGGFDKAGNLLRFETQGQAYQLTYDDSYHIISETGHKTHTYQFDSLANRTEKDGERASHNKLNQLIATANDYFAYDANGNLTKWAGKTTVHYSYDALDRLISLTIDGKTTTYHYDSFGRRLSKTKEQETVFFVYFGQEEIGLWQGGVCKELRLLGKEARSPMVVIEIDGVPYVPLNDLAGNVSVVLDLAGNVIERYRYTAFGEKEIFSPSGEFLTYSDIHNPWQYAGKRFDEESGLVAFGLRYYSPELARWITPDPAGFADGSNLYAYVHNNPLLYWDQFGLYFNVEVFTDAIGSCCSGIQSFFHSLFGQPRPPQAVHRRVEDEYKKRHQRMRRKDEFETTQEYQCNDFIDPETNQPFQGKETPDKMICFMNGIMNSFSDFKESLMYLGKLSGENVHGVHSPTRGLVTDLLHYCGALGSNYAYDEVEKIHKIWYDFFDKASEQATILMIAHSRGAVYLRNALMAAPEWVQQRIEVLAIAPGGYIDPALSKSLKHILSDRDPVPLLDMFGRAKYRDSTKMLLHHKDANPFFDHEFTSPTYEGTLREVMGDYSAR